MSIRRRARRGFTLIEAVVVIVTLSVAIPPTLMLMNDVAGARADSVQITRATTLATGVLEHVIADVSSEQEELGFDALGDESAYVNGLRDRIAWMTALYEDARLSYEVEIGPLVDSSGVVSGVEGSDVFRRVTVLVTIPLSSGSEQLAISTLVTEL